MQQSQRYFLPGWLAGEYVNCLIDTGCTASILSKQTFDLLEPQAKGSLSMEPGVVQLADGTTAMTYGNILLRGEFQQWEFDYQFWVADIKEDALIGLDFLQNFDALVNFKTSEVYFGSHRIHCADENGYMQYPSFRYTESHYSPFSTSPTPERQEARQQRLYTCLVCEREFRTRYACFRHTKRMRHHIRQKQVRPSRHHI